MTDTDRLAALLDVLREANNVIENNYGPDPSLVYDVKRWQKFQRAVNRANDLAAAGVTGGLDVERLREAAQAAAFALDFHNKTPTGRRRSCDPKCIACAAIDALRAALATGDEP